MWRDFDAAHLDRFDRRGGARHRQMRKIPIAFAFLSQQGAPGPGDGSNMA
jgi:hypothetical protein